MEANRVTSHVEFFAKACTAILGSCGKTGGTGLAKSGVPLLSRSLDAYYVGHVLKCNFFFANRIGNLHLAGAERVGPLLPALDDELQPPNHVLPVSQHA